MDNKSCQQEMKIAASREKALQDKARKDKAERERVQKMTQKPAALPAATVGRRESALVAGSCYSLPTGGGTPTSSVVNCPPGV
jgi:hypothetical protein